MSHKSYQHKAVEASTSAEVIEQTSKLGRCGWEMISVVYDQGAQKYVAFLKRKIKHPKHHKSRDESYEPGPR
jgi:hypothetical protein